MITLKSQQSKDLKAVGLDSAGNEAVLPPGTQCNWYAGDISLLSLSYPLPPQTRLSSLGPLGTSSVAVSVVLPDMRTLTGEQPVEVTVGDVVGVKIVEVV